MLNKNKKFNEKSECKGFFFDGQSNYLGFFLALKLFAHIRV
jgi:hypothetical protein